MTQPPVRQSIIGALGPLGRLLPFLAPFRRQVGFALLGVAASAFASLAVPLAAGRMINAAVKTGTLNQLGSYIGAIALLGALLGAASAFRLYYVGWIGERLVADLRKAVFAHLLRLTPAFFELNTTGGLLSQLTNDTTLIHLLAGSSVSVALRHSIVLVGAVAFIFVTSPKLALLLLLAVPLVVLPLMLFGRRVKSLARRGQEKVADSQALAGEALGAMQTVQSFTLEEDEKAAYQTATQTAFHAGLARNASRSSMTGLIIMLAFGCMAAIFWVGARDVAAGKLSVGALAQFVIYAALIVNGVNESGEAWGELQRAAGAAERLSILLAVEPAVAAPLAPLLLPAPVQASLALEDVTFRYPSRPELAALHQVAFTLAPGETAAIVGPSGAGKSTIFQLLLRFFDPQEGTVRLDGLDVARLDLTALRQAIALVPQDPVVFSGTIAQNIRLGRRDASQAALERAVENAGLSALMARLPRGLETVVGERGLSLSGGERQRIAIARAFLKDAPLLLLDEATSAVDAASEELIHTSLSRLMAGRTTIAIAHRLAFAQRFGRILVMDRGRLVADGRHEKLMAEDGLYARFAALQLAVAS